MSLFSRIAVVFASMSLLTASAFAGDWGVNVEPYVGYGVAGVFKATAYGMNDTYTSFGLGARAVVKYMDLVYLGPDFSWYPSLTTNPATTNATLSNIKFGGVAGVMLPMSFRLWVGYNFMDNFNYAPTGGTSSGINGGSFKVGAGWSPIPFLSVNAEYFFGSQGTSNSNGTSSAISPAVTTNVLFLSVSAPIALPI